MSELLDGLVKTYVNIKFMQSKLADGYKDGSENFDSYFKSVLAINDTIRLINEVDDFNSEKVQKMIKQQMLELENRNKKKGDKKE